VSVTCSSGQQATTMHSDYIRVSQPRVPLDNKQQTHMCQSRVLLDNKQQTHTCQSRVLLGNKQPPCAVITYEYHNHVSFWTSKRKHVSHSRVLLGNKHTVHRAVIHNVINMCPGRAPGKNVTDNLQSQTRVHSEQQRTGMHASQWEVFL